MAIPTNSSPVGSVERKSAQLTDTAIHPFLQPDFDPVDYLNSTLPTLSLSSSAHRGARSATLPELSAQLQTLLAQWNAQTTRLSNSLTQLTDEIIRSGSRLAYEVEVLRGETLGLTDTFENGLNRDIELIVPSKGPEKEASTLCADNHEATAEMAATTSETSMEPEFLQKLRGLTTVRERLDTVIKTFGSAMQWPLAPSEVSLTSSFISVSGPESSDDNRSREEKGKEYADKLRNEINGLLATGAEGIELASAKVEEMRALAQVFKGTAEEKARNRFVESLQKAVDEQQKAAGRTTATNAKVAPAPARSYDMRYGQPPSEGGTGYGFLQNLRNLKNEVYMD